jgi:hypothetical protein
VINEVLINSRLNIFFTNYIKGPDLIYNLN